MTLPEQVEPLAESLDPQTKLQLAYWEQNGFPPVFINYRTADIYGAVLLDQGLSEVLGEANIFSESRFIRAGARFQPLLRRAITNAKVTLAVIGPGWAESMNDGRHPWVLAELLLAQEQNVPIVPTFLSDILPPRKTVFRWLDRETLPAGLDLGLTQTVGCEFDARSHKTSAATIAQTIGHLLTKEAS